ncbi:hypothetical protein [Acetobacter sp. DsW_063]|uniref:hypothetical protein n=1 Tax=Acetobacter sp. DsW_063 TaxID=1514894 RepID=UPI000A39ABD9|nr:hypothetical protein [Acetobacter sp. DsW_063]OUJ14421.1 hypothetical protein HK28_13715 [Acetobacter sp. DsW_063]
METRFEQHLVPYPGAFVAFAGLAVTAASSAGTYFLPTTSPLIGGVAVRAQSGGALDALALNVFGTGVLVVPADCIDDFGFRVSVFDRALLQGVSGLRRVTSGLVMRETLRAAAAGFAGREAQTLARAVAPEMTRRRVELRRRLVSHAAGWMIDPRVFRWLAGVLVEAGMASLIGAGADFLAPESASPPRLTLLRDTVATLPEALPDDRGEAIRRRLCNVAKAALGRIEAMYDTLRDLVASQGMIAAYRDAAPQLFADLSTLRGWTRFCLLAREISHSPSRSHALGDLVALAQLLTHKKDLTGDEAFLANALRPGLSDWPPETDHTVYAMSRNERILRAEIMLEVGNI